MKEYKVMDAYEEKTLTVTPVGSIYVDGGCDLTASITDCNGSEIAYEDFDECGNGSDVTEWARENGFAMTDRCADFAERVIESALCYGEYKTVDSAVSHILANSPQFQHAQFIDANGDSHEYDAAVNLMDGELREQLHSQMGPCTVQDFIETYARFHEQKHGEPFAPFVGGAW